MKTFQKALTLTLAWLLAFQPALLQMAYAQSDAPAATTTAATSQPALNPDLQPRELSGFLDDVAGARRAAEKADRDTSLAEDGSPANKSPMANLPVLDTELAARSRSAAPDEALRVIIHMAYLPHLQVLEQTLQRNKPELDELEDLRVGFLEQVGARRDTSARIDSENYTDMFTLSDSEKATLRELGERNEAVSLTIKTEITESLRPLIGQSQQPVEERIRDLGGDVEFSMLTANTIVATVPASAIEELATTPGILRVVGDSLMQAHLTNADESSMVDPTDSTLSGLWDNARTGGAYDPAVIDSGIDLNHPFMRDDATQTNWSSWYVVAGVGAPNYNETCCSVDDFQGHGTHVSGIVSSKGSATYPGHLGMAHGVEKMVHLKAGWLNTAGTASMFWSDKYFLVERAINNNGSLTGAGLFADDVDGFNLSYGGSTSLNDTDGGRFWDSVVSSISDTPVTISAGNSGPSNTQFNDPAVSYNAITVANFDDRNTTSRNDDIIRFSSTVGPTANGRKKPDIAAPGTNIASANFDWETETDWVNQTGTSMSAPVVLGVLMDLMDAGVIDELRLKALLLNTAQKNLAGMNIESDSDGWDPQIGWGALNAYAAYFHRLDTFVGNLDPRDPDDLHTSNDYQLYKGSMQDEGSAGEGRDRATMVWNRVATYDANAAPSTYYSLVDLNLRLYQESNNSLIDSELGGVDNVHQVRIGSGAPPTDVVVKAYTWSATFLHGGATQGYALATEDGFTAVDFPTQFQGIAIWPSEVEPSEVFDITFWLRNDSDIASHNNQFNLELPAGWTLVAGIDTQSAGSAAAGGITDQVTYTLRAPPSPAVGAQNIVVKHSHNSYLETYGDFNWNIGLTVAVDNTPPNPNPMSFSALPFDVTTSSISMTAAFANDLHGPVEYYLDYTSSPSGGSGGSDSGWQSSRSFTDTSLTANDEYCYRAWARDNAAFPNLTTPSAIDCTYTSQATPAGVNIDAVTTTSITVSPTSAPNNLTLDLSGLLLRNATLGTTSGWVQNTNPWNSAGLTPATAYTFDAQARNGDGDVTSDSTPSSVYTLANPPAVDSLLTTSDSEIKVILNANGNGAEAEYLIQNTSNGTDSGWINDTTYSFEGLDCDTFYNFQARARNGDGVETIIVALGQQTTDVCSLDSDGDGVADDLDNCTIDPNADQRDTNGDGFGNVCDTDLNNDGISNLTDLILFKAAFGTADPDADFNGDGAVNLVDLITFKARFGMAPGPSGIAP